MMKKPVLNFQNRPVTVILSALVLLLGITIGLYINRMPGILHALDNSEDILTSDALKEHLDTLPPDSVHVLVHDDGRAYSTWQTRVNYHNFQKYRKPWMRGYTRIVHRTTRNFTQSPYEDPNLRICACEIPCVQVQSFEAACDVECDYVPKERIFSSKLFFKEAQQNPSLIQGRWILVLDPDMVITPAFPYPGDATDPLRKNVAGRYGHIYGPSADNIDILKRKFNMTYSEILSMPHSGMAPVLMRVEDWLRVIDLAWEMQKVLLKDREAQNIFSWTSEMWAFAIAVGKLHIPIVKDNQLQHIPPYYMGEDPYKFSFLKNQHRDDTYLSNIPKIENLPSAGLNYSDEFVNRLQFLRRTEFGEGYWMMKESTYPAVNFLVQELIRSDQELPNSFHEKTCVNEVPYIEFL